MDIKNYKGLEIFLGYSCNLNCSFCFQKDLRLKKKGFLKYKEIIRIINKGIKNGKKYIIFSGGESTLDPNILKYIKYCKTNGYLDIRIHTNGLNFSDMNFLKKFINNGINGVIISVHGFGIIHDNLVSYNGAFEKLKKTFINLYNIKKQQPEFVIDTNTVLTKYNYNNLDKLFKFLSYFPITRSQIVQLYSLYLFSKEEKEKLYIDYEKFSKYLPNIIKNGKNITLENFPFCKIEKKYWDTIIKRQKYNNDAYGNMGEGFEESDCTFLKDCINCKKYKECIGIPKDYLSIFGKEKFIL